MRRPYPTKISPYGPGSGVLAHRRGHFFIRRPYFTILSPLMSSISLKLRYNLPMCTLTLWRSIWRS